MVRNKMEQKEYIILCLEDSNDWSNATSRRMVMQVHNTPSAKSQCREEVSSGLICGLAALCKSQADCPHKISMIPVASLHRANLDTCMLCGLR